MKKLLSLLLLLISLSAFPQSQQVKWYAESKIYTPDPGTYKNWLLCALGSDNK